MSTQVVSMLSDVMHPAFFPLFFCEAPLFNPFGLAFLQLQSNGCSERAAFSRSWCPRDCQDVAAEEQGLDRRKMAERFLREHLLSLQPLQQGGHCRREYKADRLGSAQPAKHGSVTLSIPFCTLFARSLIWALKMSV